MFASAQYVYRYSRCKVTAKVKVTQYTLYKSSQIKRDVASSIILWILFIFSKSKSQQNIRGKLKLHVLYTRYTHYTVWSTSWPQLRNCNNTKLSACAISSSYGTRSTVCWWPDLPSTLLYFNAYCLPIIFRLFTTVVCCQGRLIFSALWYRRGIASF